MSDLAIESKPALKAQSLWTPAFTLLCLTVLLGYAHQSLLNPVIPLYVEDKGGSAFLAGLVLLGFSVPSFMVRPFFGYLADAWSAAGVLAIGLVLLAAGGLLYLTPFLAMLFVAGIVRGLGWAGVNTGGYTLLATAAPLARRGEASGYYSGVTSSATILFPALALWLIDAPGGGFHVVFVIASGIALAGLPLAYFVLRPLSRRDAEATPKVADVQPPGQGISAMLDRGVLLATGLNLCSTLASPSVNAFLPLYAKHLGIGSIGLFYVIAGATSILIRPLLGRQSDSMGRGPSIALGFVSQLIGLALIVSAQNLPMILAGGVFTSFGFALNSSATTALAMDLANPARRGRSMATFSISFQLGTGFGAMIAGAIADLAGFRGMYVGAAVIVTLGLVLLSLCWKSLKTPTAASA